jgi:hypothetical protein
MRAIYVACAVAFCALFASGVSLRITPADPSREVANLLIVTNGLLGAILGVLLFGAVH